MTTNPITVEHKEDNTYEILYFGKVAGWIRWSERLRIYRALTINNSVRHFATFAAAKEFIIEEYH